MFKPIAIVCRKPKPLSLGNANLALKSWSRSHLLFHGSRHSNMHFGLQHPGGSVAPQHHHRGQIKTQRPGNLVLIVTRLEVEEGGVDGINGLWRLLRGTHTRLARWIQHHIFCLERYILWGEETWRCLTLAEVFAETTHASNTHVQPLKSFDQTAISTHYYRSWFFWQASGVWSNSMCSCDTLIALEVLPNSTTDFKNINQISPRSTLRKPCLWRNASRIKIRIMHFCLVWSENYWCCPFVALNTRLRSRDCLSISRLLASFPLLAHWNEENISRFDHVFGHIFRSVFKLLDSGLNSSRVNTQALSQSCLALLGRLLVCFLPCLHVVINFGLLRILKMSWRISRLIMFLGIFSPQLWIELSWIGTHSRNSAEERLSRQCRPKKRSSGERAKIRFWKP